MIGIISSFNLSHPRGCHGSIPATITTSHHFRNIFPTSSSTTGNCHEDCNSKPRYPCDCRHVPCILAKPRSRNNKCHEDSGSDIPMTSANFGDITARSEMVREQKRQTPDSLSTYLSTYQLLSMCIYACIRTHICMRIYIYIYVFIDLFIQ